jgi:hypothetical protein
VDAATKTAARVVKDFILNYGTQWRVKGLLSSIEVGKGRGKRVKTMALTDPERMKEVSKKGLKLDKFILKAKTATTTSELADSSFEKKSYDVVKEAFEMDER